MNKYCTGNSESSARIVRVFEGGCGDYSAWVEYGIQHHDEIGISREDLMLWLWSKVRGDKWT